MAYNEELQKTLELSCFNLAEKIGETLQQKGWSLSAAESCTGGGINFYCTAISGSSAWLNAGFVTYSNEMKHQLLDVNLADLEQHGAVSETVVRQMAEGARRVAGAEIGLATSGIAGPAGGSKEKPVGTVWFAWVLPNQTLTDCCVFDGSRHEVRLKAIQHAFKQLLSFTQN